MHQSWDIAWKWTRYCQEQNLGYNPVMFALQITFPVVLALLALFEAWRGFRALQYGERQATLLFAAALVCAAMSAITAYSFTQ